MAGTWLRIGACGLMAVLAFGYAAASHAASPAPSASALSPEDTLLQAATSAPTSSDRYQARHWLRQKIVRESDLSQYGLRLDDGWHRAADHQPVVVLIHGFNSTPLQNAALIDAFRAAELPCGTFAYPNDHAIVPSAQLLSCELRRFAQQHPQRRVVLVCHSMGGLVARACLEDPLYDPGNVERLIMIAPPTHGSMLAHFAVGTDLWEHWIARRQGSPWLRLRDSIVDGLGEAAGDLSPGSEFLLDLNSRPRNPRVRYSILLGTAARIKEPQLVWIRESVLERAAKVPGANGSAERLAAILDDIDELVEGLGDGIVAVKRGRLDGVSDTLVMPFGHVAVTGEPRDDVLREVQRAVLERVQ